MVAGTVISIQMNVESQMAQISLFANNMGETISQNSQIKMAPPPQRQTADGKQSQRLNQRSARRRMTKSLDSAEISGRALARSRAATRNVDVSRTRQSSSSEPSQNLDNFSKQSTRPTSRSINSGLRLMK
ncbi:MAG: hypothetical protein ACI8RA_003026 [Chlamydiales bacterium]|jgi:hypothetical protein